MVQCCPFQVLVKLSVIIFFLGLGLDLFGSLLSLSLDRTLLTVLDSFLASGLVLVLAAVSFGFGTSVSFDFGLVSVKYFIWYLS